MGGRVYVYVDVERECECVCDSQAATTTPADYNPPQPHPNTQPKQLKRRPSHIPSTSDHGHGHHHAPQAITARNRTVDTAMTDNVRAILPPSGGSTTQGRPPSPLEPQQSQQQQEERESLTTALNATFRFALPDECLPARGLEAVEWLAKGPPRVRACMVVVGFWVWRVRLFFCCLLARAPLGRSRQPNTHLIHPKHLKPHPISGDPHLRVREAHHHGRHPPRGG